MAARSDREVSPLRHWQSANTAYDQSLHLFAYNVSGSEQPATCSGFLLRGEIHNIGFRLAPITGKIDPNELSILRVLPCVLPVPLLLRRSRPVPWPPGACIVPSLKARFSRYFTASDPRVAGGLRKPSPSSSLAKFSILSTCSAQI
jgi:hypothetical protein